VTRKKFKNPPKFAEWILSCFYPDRGYFTSVGDFREEYLEAYQSSGPFKANLWYWKQVAKSIPSFLRNKGHWNVVMIDNYLKIAIRNIKRNKTFSFINMVGLVVGMTCFILIVLFIRYELSFDTFHGKADTIYRIYAEYPGVDYLGRSCFAGSPGVMAQTLMDELPEVVSATKIGRHSNTLIKYRDKAFYENGIYADENFLHVFTFPLIQGDPGIALNDPFSVIISETLAEKLFDHENPIGKTLNFDRQHDLKITGIHKDVPDNSHLKFSFVVSFATLTVNKRALERINHWDAYMYFTYIVLPENYDFKEMERKISIVANKYAREIMELDCTIYRLQPLKKIHLHSNFNNEIAVNNSDIKYIYLFAVLGFVLLIIACINNMNLTTARASKRAKEIGIRKVIGTKKEQLFAQFIVESFALIVISSFIALAAVGCLLQWFKGFVNRDIEIDLFQNMDLMALLAGVVFFTGLLSGSYPALFLSSFRPINILKGTFNPSSKGAKSRNVLVITQFSVSIILIAVTLIVFDQLQFMMTADVGYNRDHIVVLRVRDPEARQQYTAIKNRLLQHRNVTSVTSSSYLPSEVLHQRTPKVKLDNGQEVRIPIAEVMADYNYLDFFQIKFIKGRNFSREFSTDEKEAVIINETAAERFGWKEPLGRAFHDYGKVIGVVRDFHFLSFHHRIKPMVFKLSPNNNFFISVKIQSTEIPETLAYLDRVFDEFSADYPFIYEFFDEMYYRQYRSERQLGSLLGHLAGLSIFIACFGLFGLALFEAERKTKEIGIRKTLGASVSHIARMLSREYIKLFVISSLIAYPVVYICMNRWLQNYAYRIDIGWIPFVGATVIAIVLALLTVSFQTLRAAAGNPVDLLRYE
jgi:putative ABC transport system permease protein